MAVRGGSELMRCRRNEFAFHAVNASELGDIGSQGIKANDPVLIVAVAVARGVTNSVVPDVAIARLMAAFVNHRRTQ